MESIDLVSPDISCDHCKMTIEKELGQVDGVQQVNVAVPTKTIHVSYDPARVRPDTIEQRIEELEYSIAR